jgi:hypothetical protein
MREKAEPLSELIPIKVAVRLRDIVAAFERDLPRDSSEVRLARLRMPRSSTGAVLREGASVGQAATHAAMKVLEQWVRILRPFASSPELGMLISRIVHMDPQKSADGWEATGDSDTKFLEVVPPLQRPIGAALRRVVPHADTLLLEEWPWIEDVQEALSYEESFDRTSVIHQSNVARSDTSRPQTTGQIKKKEAQDPNVRMRLSGAFPWANFQSSSGFRATTTYYIPEKELRKIPGPGLYGDYMKNLAKPGTAPRAVYPSVGERRAQCQVSALSVLDRFFTQDFSLE